MPLTAIPVRVEIAGAARRRQGVVDDDRGGVRPEPAGETLPARSVIEPAFSSRVTVPLPQPLTPTA